MSLSLCSSIHLLQRSDFEIRNKFIVCCSTHIGYMLRHGGDSGEGPLSTAKLYFAIIQSVTCPLKMKTALERMHLSLAVVRLSAQLHFLLKPVLLFWAVTVGFFGQG